MTNRSSNDTISWIDEIINEEAAKPAVPIKNKRPNTSLADMVYNINEQRKIQRKAMFIFVIIVTSIIMICFMAMILANAIYFCINGEQIFSDTVLNIIGVSFFADIIATIKIITEKLWDEKQFLDTDAVKSLKNEE